MKKYTIFLLAFVLTISGSWKVSRSNLINANSWGISIGEKYILASWLNNEMGDMAILDRKTLMQRDTLLVQQYLCGRNGLNSTTTLTIKNNENEIIKESTNKDNAFMFTAKMPLADILNSAKIKDNQIVSVYFTIDSKSEKIDQTVLLGRLMLK